MRTYNDRQKVVMAAETAADHFRLGRIAEKHGIATMRFHVQSNGKMHLRLTPAEAMLYVEGAETIRPSARRGRWGRA